jgi:hypothetical protein
MQCLPIRPILKLKNQPEQLKGYIPLDIVIPIEDYVLLLKVDDYVRNDRMTFKSLVKMQDISVFLFNEI